MILADEPRVDDVVVRAVVGAVSEALTNAAKHGAPPTATVYVDRAEDGGLFCSIKDDGRGFDDATTPKGIGISRSIRGRHRRGRRPGRDRRSPRPRDRGAIVGA